MDCARLTMLSASYRSVSRRLILIMTALLITLHLPARIIMVVLQRCREPGGFLRETYKKLYMLDQDDIIDK